MSNIEIYKLFIEIKTEERLILELIENVFDVCLYRKYRNGKLDCLTINNKCGNSYCLDYKNEKDAKEDFYKIAKIGIPSILSDDGIEAKRIIDYKKNKDELLNRDVETLEISVRIYNAIHSERIETIRDLVSRTENEMLLMPNFGRTSLYTLRKALGKLGLNFKLALRNYD